MNIDDEDSVLDPVKHGPIIRGMDKYPYIHGIPGNPQYVWRSLLTNPDVSDGERDAIAGIYRLNKKGLCGIVFVGADAGKMSRKFMAFTGLLIREYKDPYYCPMGMYTGLMLEGEVPDHNVFFSPDFISKQVATTRKKEGITEKVPVWKREAWLSHLMEQQAYNNIMALGVSDLDDVEEIYGPAIASFIGGNYQKVGV
jgi:hypothetical protein